VAKKRGKAGKEAELLFEKWLRFLGYTWYHRYRATGHANFSRSHDLFKAIDFQTIVNTGTPWEPVHPVVRSGARYWLVQVTTQNGRASRRRKIEEVPWPYLNQDLVDLVTHETVDDPADRNQKMHYWRIERYDRYGWHKPIAVRFDKDEVENYAREARRRERAKA